MANMNKHQRNYWYPLVMANQHGEYCKGCGISPSSDWSNRTIKTLDIDRIDNSGIHSISESKVDDFQLLCRSCNTAKNPPHKKPEREQTQSEFTNGRVEKPFIEWVIQKLREEDDITWKYVVSEGSFLFDISPETIERRYYKKYFSPDARSSPIGLDMNEREETIVVLKSREEPRQKLNVNGVRPKLKDSRV